MFEVSSPWIHDYMPELIDVPKSNLKRSTKTLYEETSICRQESKEENSAMPQPETTMTNPETATSPSANPPYNNDDRLPELPLPVPLVHKPKQVSESDHEHTASKPTHVPKSALSNSAPKSMSNHATTSACKPKLVKKQKTASKSDNPFDVFDNPIDCSLFDKFKL